MSVLKGIDVIRRWVMGQLTKKADDGIMITLPDMKKVELNTNITIERFLQNGINPKEFKNTNQVENAINQLNSMTVNRPGKKGIMKAKSAEIFDLEGQKIKNPENIMGGKEVGMFDNIFNKMQNEMKGLKTVDDDLPPPGSRGGKDDIAAPVQSSEETIKNMIEAENKKNINKIKERNKNKPEPEDKADGGRIGYKKGSVDLARRGFMKAAAGVGAGIGALKMGALKLFGKGTAREVAKDVIKTDPVPGKPEWFDALVTKVINQGEDVTKKFATQEREIVHKLDIDKFEDVTVYRNIDTGEIRVSYESPTNVGEESIDLVYKKSLPDEGDPRPSAEFYAVEPEPRVVNRDGDMEMDGENFVNNIDELMSDTTKLKIIAKGDAKPNLKEFVMSKKKKDAAKKLNEDPMEQAEYIENKYGPGPEPDFDDIENFASGGIAGMLGE